MAIKIIADSSCDLNDEIKKQMKINIAPLILQLDDKTFIDNKSLNVKAYVKEIGDCKVAPKTACPSPNDYMKMYEGPESIFVVTLSNALSGSYNSAVLAKDLFLVEIENKFIQVFDSLSASAGETLVVLKIHELEKLNLGDMEIVDKVSSYIKEMKTFFLLENLEHLAKSGRLNPIVARIASMLAIKPIMGGAEDGTIKLIEKTRGYKKAFRRLVEIIGEEGKNLEEKILGIAHCNCLDRALALKQEALDRYNFKDIIIVEMSGLSSTYANNGGIVIAF